MENAPTGSQRLCRFAATNRELTKVEEAEFLEGKGLPAATGVDPTTVFFDYTTPNGTTTTKEGTSQITRDAAGAFHYVIRVEESGPYHWRGYGKDSEGKALFSTKKQSFRGMQF